MGRSSNSDSPRQLLKACTAASLAVAVISLAVAIAIIVAQMTQSGGQIAGSVNTTVLNKSVPGVSLLEQPIALLRISELDTWPRLLTVVPQALAWLCFAVCAALVFFILRAGMRGKLGQRRTGLYVVILAAIPTAAGLLGGLISHWCSQSVLSAADLLGDSTQLGPLPSGIDLPITLAGVVGVIIGVVWMTFGKVPDKPVKPSGPLVQGEVITPPTKKDVPEPSTKKDAPEPSTEILKTQVPEEVENTTVIPPKPDPS